ncbi:PREDICTED: acetylajmalan esterase-like isoform X2 [Ipomoea nil]|uniref:acetylajmalan esterase-like isoform X2 n=1 Tax=Ipomoea nil TaxID=35883 RepID=UPI000901E59A|nr:PREDICTED: acetylajmalan esterase-like isoform X2 [Ipomoea nil]
MVKTRMLSMLFFTLLIFQQFVDAIQFNPVFFSWKIDKIYQLGDSISDTGNLIRESPVGAISPYASLPYGETFFKKATGRCSDGLLMIDFFALAFGLPLLNPNKNTNANFSNGVNFAVAGSTALSVEALAAKNIQNPVTASSLAVQLGWMDTYFNSTCNGTQSGCAETRNNSLFMVGETGGNDINYAFVQGKNMEELRSMVPEIVQVIMVAVKKVISYGATRIIVPGNFPIGCIPMYLTGFQTNEPSAYDEHHCLRDFNNLSIYHNDLLKQAIQDLQKQHPHVTMIYGFDESSIQKSCCGVGGNYDFNMNQMCGFPGVPVCSDPSKRISWDGIHMTQNAYRIMTNWLLHDMLGKIQAGNA